MDKTAPFLGRIQINRSYRQQRQIHLELTALPGCGGNAYGSAVGSDDLPYNGKSETGAVFLGGDKGMKDVRKLLGSHTAAVIFHGDQKFLLLNKDFQDNLPAAGNGFHCIFQKIDTGLF